MQKTIQIAIRDLSHADTVRSEIEKAADALERFHDRITSIHVSVREPDHRHRTGGILEVHVTVKVPGHGDILVMRRADDKPERSLLNVAVREAFAEARRQLQDAVRKMRGDVKTHVEPDLGKVVRIFPDRDYGFIQTADGREVYFHRNSLVSANFDKLAAGTQVRFVESLDGDKGPQASTVHVVHKGQPH